MATQFADILFVIVAAAVAVSQAFILRSTARGIRYSDAKGNAAQAASAANAANATASSSPVARPRRTALEWSYAIVPALALVALLAFSWRAMHPSSLRVQGTTPPAGFER